MHFRGRCLGIFLASEVGETYAIKIEAGDLSCFRT